jgi:hypothetical protein
MSSPSRIPSRPPNTFWAVDDTNVTRERAQPAAEVSGAGVIVPAAVGRRAGATATAGADVACAGAGGGAAAGVAAAGA